MKGILICPAERTAVRLLAEHIPLAVLPIVGQSLVEYWLQHVAANGLSEVLILANDRPEQVSAVAGDGARWGIAAEVVPESRELTAGEALLKYQNWLGDPSVSQFVAVMDHLPGETPGGSLNSYAGWYEALIKWLPKAQTADRVGIRELAPGIWSGVHSHISKDAKITGPCWIGQKVFLGSEAVIGPNAIIEDGAFIEPGVEVAESYIGVHTFVGRYTEIKTSIALGNTLLNWKSGSFTKVPDPFVLCALRQPSFAKSPGVFGRLASLYSKNKFDAHLLWKQLLLDKES